jgi:putative sterol carrier protein
VGRDPGGDGRKLVPAGACDRAPTGSPLMSLDSITAAIRAKAGTSPALGYRVQFDLGEDGVVFWDGTGAAPIIDNTARDADTVMSLSLANLEALVAGTLNPTMAYMTGKLKIQGSMGVALKIGQLLEE